MSASGNFLPSRPRAGGVRGRSPAPDRAVTPARTAMGGGHRDAPYPCHGENEGTVQDEPTKGCWATTSAARNGRGGWAGPTGRPPGVVAPGTGSSWTFDDGHQPPAVISTASRLGDLPKGRE